MIVSELIKKLNEMPQDKSITCQVVANNGDVWNCDFDITDIKDSWMVNIKVSHPKLESLSDRPSLSSQ